MRRRLWLAGGCGVAVMAAALLAGCAGPQPAPIKPIGASTAPVGGTCDAQAAQWALGKGGTARVLEQARVRAGARMVRALHVGQAVTLEFDAERLNLTLDASGKVVRATCG